MIEAKISSRFRRLFHAYQQYYLIPKHFHAVYVKGVPEEESGVPVLYYANHSSWWDGLLLFQAASRFSEKSHYFLMEEEQLSRFRFFSRLGAFSIDRSSVSEIRKTMKFALQRLREKEAVWIFPQGTIIHQESRPLEFEPGAAFLALKSGRAIIKPVTLHYSFNHHQLPSVSILFGESISIPAGSSRKDASEMLKSLLEEQLDRHRNDAVADPRYEQNMGNWLPIIKPRLSASDWYITMKGWFRK